MWFEALVICDLSCFYVDCYICELINTKFKHSFIQDDGQPEKTSEQENMPTSFFEWLLNIWGLSLASTISHSYQNITDSPFAITLKCQSEKCPDFFLWEF